MRVRVRIRRPLGTKRAKLQALAESAHFAGPAPKIPTGRPSIINFRSFFIFRSTLFFQNYSKFRLSRKHFIFLLKSIGTFLAAIWSFLGPSFNQLLIFVRASFWDTLFSSCFQHDVQKHDLGSPFGIQLDPKTTPPIGQAAPKAQKKHRCSSFWAYWSRIFPDLRDGSLVTKLYGT